MSDNPRPHQLVTSVDSSDATGIRSLLTASKRARRNQVLLENDVNIRDAVRAGLDIVAVYVAEGRPDPDVIGELPSHVPVRAISREVMGAIFEATRAPAVFAVAHLPKRRTLQSLQDVEGDLVVLDDLQGPGNTGSIIRIATAFEAAGIVFLNQPYMEIYRRGIVRASMGNMFKTPLVTATTEAMVRHCRAHDVRIVLTTPHAEEDFTAAMTSTERLAIVFGNEAHGCAKELYPHADMYCRIPMSDRVESLNVSAAASILLFLRSRHFAATRRNLAMVDL